MLKCVKLVTDADNKQPNDQQMTVLTLLPSPLYNVSAIGAVYSVVTTE